MFQLLLAAGSLGALGWASLDSFLKGDQPTTVVNVEKGATLNQAKGVPGVVVIGGALIAAWWLLGRKK